MNRKGIAKIIGRQIVRVDFARIYFAIVMSVFSALSLFSIYLATIDITITLADYFILLSIALALFWVLGYVLDKMKVIDADRELRNEKIYSAQRQLWEKAIIPPLKKMIEEIIDQKLKEE